MKIGQLSQLLGGNLNKLLKPNVKSQGSEQVRQDSYQARGREIAASVLNDKLSKALGMEKAQETKPEPLFDFEEVVKNVLQFVQGAVRMAQADGADDDKLKSMLGEARKGVQIGIDDAYKELSESGILSDDIEEGITRSRDGIFEGLDKFEEDLFNPQPKSVSVTQAQYFALSNDAEYNFTTAEGDKVTISFAGAYSESAAQSVSQSGDKAGYAAGFEQRQELSFSMSVNGELNEQEQEAINELMGNLQGISDSFFRGDYDEAFSKAQELQLGNDQLAAFTMDLKQTKTAAAIKEYQQAVPAQEVAKELKPFNDSLKEAYHQAGELGLQNELSGLMLWLNEGRGKEKIEQFIEYSRSVFALLSEQLSASQQQKGGESDKETSQVEQAK